MRAVSVALAALVAAPAAIGAAAAPAEPCPVLNVPAHDRVVVRYQGLPVDVPLAHIEVPPQAAARTAARERLQSLLKGKKVELVTRPSFGSDGDGAARVHLVLDKAMVSQVLIAGGFAKYQQGARVEAEYDDPLRKAQERAQKNQAGLWSKQGAWAESAPPAAPAAPPAAAGDEPAVAASQPAPAPAPAAPAAATRAAPKGPFCSELNSKWYFPSDHRAVANVSAQRLIYYPDEASARRAGKQPSPQAETDSISAASNEAGADEIFAKGKEAYAQAVNMPATDERDRVYEKAFVILSKAMQIYSALVEASPDDEALAEKLRECMQLRYGTVKQRRFH